MEALEFFGHLVLLVGVSLPVLALAHRLKLPAVAGFLLSGVAIGPGGLALIPQEEVSELAELGVILLLFTIGLELSLERVVQMGRAVLQGGGLQVLSTLVVIALFGIARGEAPSQWTFYGSLIALSSTAIVLRSYADRTELDTPHGRTAVSILLFQDLCVVPLMLMVPLLAGGGEAGASGAWRATIESLLVVAGLVLAGRLAVPQLLELVAGFRDRELFTLTIAFLALGAAFTTASFGLSLALGAFVAGLVISESEYGLQALSDVRPFRDTFSGIFFTSVGMLLDIELLVRRPTFVIALTLAVIVGKTTVVTLVTRTLKRPLRTSLITGLGLAQVGEFSFVLAEVGQEHGLFTGSDYQIFLAVSVLSMLATPLFIAAAPWVAEQLTRRRGALEPAGGAPEQQLSDHAVIVGYGLSGRHLAKVLHEAGFPYVVLEQNGYLVRKARAGGFHVVYGDGTAPDVLEHVGIARARVIVFAISSPADERAGVAVAKRLNPSIRNIVRTRYVRSIDQLMKLGATEVIVEEFEATIELFGRVLAFYEIPSNTIHRELEALRAEHYGMLRGTAHPDLKLDTLRHLGIHSALEIIEIEADSEAIGESPTSLDLRRETGAVAVAVLREGSSLDQSEADFRFQTHDTVVLVGRREALRKAAEKFQGGAPQTS